MNPALEKFKKLLNISSTLMGPEGCPWDRAQTLVSMRNSVLEEACEVIEAIDEGNDGNLVEELGDLLFNVLFFSQLGEKENRFTLEQILETICQKLILRHPHVFGDVKLETSSEVMSQWERIKKEEKKERESLMDGIPKGLPALSKAYKMVKKGDGFFTARQEGFSFETEAELGELLWNITKAARKKGLQPEHALRKTMVDKESDFRNWEKENKN